MNTALFVVYLLVLIAIVVGAAWALQIVRELQTRLRDDQQRLSDVRAELATLRSQLSAVDKRAGQPDVTVSRLNTFDGRFDKISAWFDELGKRIDGSAARFDQLQKNHAELAGQQVTVGTRVVGLSELLGEVQRRVGDLADRLTAVEREALPRLAGNQSQLARTTWEIGAAQTFGVPPTLPWLPGHLLLSPDADGETILSLYASAATELDLEIVHVSEPRLDGGRRAIALRMTSAPGQAAIGRLAARIEERVALLDTDSGPSPDDALAGLLLAAATATRASVLLGPLLCVTDGDGTHVHLLRSEQLRGLIGVGGPGPDTATLTAGAAKAIELGPWLRSRRDAERSAAELALARERLKEELRQAMGDELRAEVGAEEIERIKTELRAELTPMVRRDLERELRRRPPRSAADPSPST